MFIDGLEVNSVDPLGKPWFEASAARTVKTRRTNTKYTRKMGIRTRVMHTTHIKSHNPGIKLLKAMSKELYIYASRAFS